MPPSPASAPPRGWRAFAQRLLAELALSLRALWPAALSIDAREKWRACIGAGLGILVAALGAAAFAPAGVGGAPNALAAALVAPLGASAVLVFAVPASPLAQPWSVLAGNTSWEDMQNRGGMGGGMQIVMRQGPPGQELNAEQIEQARLRRFRNELNRYLLAFAGGASLQPTFVAVAEAPDGKADVVELKNEAGQAVRLFVDQQTHLPLMLQYMEVRPRINMMGGPGGPGGPGGGRRAPGGPDGPPPPPPPGGGAPAAGAPADGQRPSPEEVRRRIDSMPPPEPSQMTMYLADFKKVDGVMLPHRVTIAADGKPVEEWTIEKLKVNPSVKADLFDKK